MRRSHQPDRVVVTDPTSSGGPLLATGALSEAEATVLTAVVSRFWPQLRCVRRRAQTGA